MSVDAQPLYNKLWIKSGHCARYTLEEFRKRINYEIDKFILKVVFSVRQERTQYLQSKSGAGECAPPSEILYIDERMSRPCYDVAMVFDGVVKLDAVLFTSFK